jgi:hypothetical protein
MNTLYYGDNLGAVQRQVIDESVDYIYHTILRLLQLLNEDLNC